MKSKQMRQESKVSKGSGYFLWWAKRRESINSKRLDGQIEKGRINFVLFQRGWLRAQGTGPYVVACIYIFQYNKYVNVPLQVINGPVRLEEETLVPLVAMCRRCCRVRYGQSYLHPLSVLPVHIATYRMLDGSQISARQIRDDTNICALCQLPKTTTHQMHYQFFRRVCDT